MMTSYLIMHYYMDCMLKDQLYIDPNELDNSLNPVDGKRDTDAQYIGVIRYDDGRGGRKERKREGERGTIGRRGQYRRCRVGRWGVTASVIVLLAGSDS
jgi:hypothetical protein